MTKSKPTRMQQLALRVTDDETFYAVGIGIISFILSTIIGGIIFFLKTGYLDNQIIPITGAMFAIWIIPAIVAFFLSEIYFHYISQHYVQQNIGNSYMASSMLLEIDQYDRVIHYTLRRLMLKTLDYPCTYNYANLYFFWPDTTTPWRKEYVQTMDHEFEILAETPFGLKLKISLELEMLKDFDPQEIYELLAKPEIDMRRYFGNQLDQTIKNQQGFLIELAKKYYQGEITEGQFANEVLKALKITCKFSNLKIRQKLLDKPIRYVLH